MRVRKRVTWTRPDAESTRWRLRGTRDTNVGELGNHRNAKRRRGRVEIGHTHLESWRAKTRIEAGGRTGR